MQKLLVIVVLYISKRGLFVCFFLWAIQRLHVKSSGLNSTSEQCIHCRSDFLCDQMLWQTSVTKGHIWPGWAICCLSQTEEGWENLACGNVWGQCGVCFANMALDTPLRLQLEKVVTANTILNSWEPVCFPRCMFKYWTFLRSQIWTSQYFSWHFPPTFKMLF